MDAEQSIKERVDRFVEEILDLIRQAEGAALQKVQAMQGEAPRPSQTRRLPRRTDASRSRQPVPAVPSQTQALNAAPIQAGTANGSAATASPIQAGISKGATSTPGTGNRAPAATEREARVLAALRSLVRAATGQIAERSGLPNGTVYVALKTLVAAGRVARTETARGIEYSLVSLGEIRPFKRAKSSRSVGDPPA